MKQISYCVHRPQYIAKATPLMYGRATLDSSSESNSSVPLSVLTVQLSPLVFGLKYLLSLALESADVS